jgi:hypothetical protein
LLVEMWGGGGAGTTQAGGGEGGAYSRIGITVMAGETYNVVVGTGGSGANGVDGDDSQIADLSGTILIFAGGGSIGTFALNGISGAGGVANTDAIRCLPFCTGL